MVLKPLVSSLQTMIALIYTKKNITGIKVLMTCFILSGFLNSNAQDGALLYRLHLNPQSSYVNPASIPHYKYYIGFPFLSSINASLHTGNLSYNDIFYKLPNGNITIDTLKFQAHTKANNRIAQEINYQVLAFGLNFQHNSLNFSINTRINSFGNFTANQVDYFIHASNPAPGHSLNLGNLLGSSMAYTEIGVGYARQINKYLSAGIRTKLLMGWFDFNTKSSSMYLDGVPNSSNVTVTSDLLYRYSTPLSDSAGFSENPVAHFTDAYGVAFDLGVNYILKEKFIFSLSVLDLGFINWPNNVEEARSNQKNAPYTFTGFNFDEFFRTGELNDSIFNDEWDSLKNSLDFKTGKGSGYRTNLPARIYFSGSYQLTPKDEFMLLFKETAYKNANMYAITIGYYRQFGKHFTLTAGNTFQQYSWFNPGIGFAANAGPIQFYLLLDQASSIYLKNMKNFNALFGINLVFDYTDQAVRSGSVEW